MNIIDLNITFTEDGNGTVVEFDSKDTDTGNAATLIELLELAIAVLEDDDKI